jgi:hypothetical protein
MAHFDAEDCRYVIEKGVEFRFIERARKRTGAHRMREDWNGADVEGRTCDLG